MFAQDAINRYNRPLQNIIIDRYNRHQRKSILRYSWPTAPRPPSAHMPAPETSTCQSTRTSFKIQEGSPNMQRPTATVHHDVLQRPAATVHRVLREHTADVFPSRPQCTWKPTDEWAIPTPAHETDLHQTPHALKIWAVHQRNPLHTHTHIHTHTHTHIYIHIHIYITNHVDRPPRSQGHTESNISIYLSIYLYIV